MKLNNLVYLSIIALALFSTPLSATALNNKSALILIEYQNEWLNKAGKLRQLLVKDEKRFNSAIQRSKTLLAIARKQEITIIHVTLKPDAQYRIFGQADFGLRNAIPNAKTWQGDMKLIHPDFTPLQGEHVITERTGASGFSGSNLNSFLRNNGIETIFLAGFATHVCVESTLREAHDKGYTTYVVTDASAAFTKKQQHYFETEILHHFGQGINVEQFETLNF
ncbi:cysteine hydrolase [Thalassotalea sp. 1_MG-2023]|uniref:cysteine hydrolase n=1 Tax=Thalassotalea sp. 1_MG-2023 TaxID=3062680 RepID=UPI0026E255DF|nr:cysteine hydrolase [Thalassotalea sp. 1_MG-2023]MDO6425975.1 cysteine hydrolase [Thalassotalea sp. 1_MG-2023]